MEPYFPQETGNFPMISRENVENIGRTDTSGICRVAWRAEQATAPTVVRREGHPQGASLRRGKPFVRWLYECGTAAASGRPTVVRREGHPQGASLRKISISNPIGKLDLTTTIHSYLLSIISKQNPHGPCRFVGRCYFRDFVWIRMPRCHCGRLQLLHRFR